ncbi:MAG: NAD(P)/FAD-dependent oxidoreductase [Chthoniobacterales bacterium]
MAEAFSSEAWEYDVAVVGGALSGAATALLLKREDPDLRVLVIEKNETFKRRVGEATVEVSAYFLCRVLGLTQFLTQTQMSKNGLRFWFANKEAEDLGGCSEIGGKYLSTVPSFLIDRSVVDEEVLRRAEETGADVWRPAAVTSIALHPGGEQTLQVRTAEGPKTVRARWVVDASGIKAMLARAEGWLEPNTRHPTLSAWSRWRGTGDWDAAGLGDRHEGWQSSYVGIRGTATNHIAGDGWWAWWIALKGGDTSIGVVLDQSCADWPEEKLPVGEKLRDFLGAHPAAREMMSGAEFVAGDVHFRRNLPYCSRVQAGDGFVLTGDASAFLDPLYSPGMDWIAFTTLGAVRLIRAWRAGEETGELLARHNADFLLSYQRMFEALYENKYEYLGDYDIMRLAFRLDIALYYLFIVKPIFAAGGAEGFVQPPYAAREAGPFFAIMRLYNRRFAAMARQRRASGTFGCHNARERDLFAGFNFRVPYLLKVILGALAGWFWLEVREGWRSWGRRKPAREESPGAAPAVMDYALTR